MSRKKNVVNGRVRLRASTVGAKTGGFGSLAFLHHGFIFQMIASSFATGTRKQNESRVARPQALHSGNCPAMLSCREPANIAGSPASQILRSIWACSMSTLRAHGKRAPDPRLVSLLTIFDNEYR